MKIGMRALGYVNLNVSYSAGLTCLMDFLQIGVEVNCDQTDAPTEAFEVGQHISPCTPLPAKPYDQYTQRDP